MQPNEQIEQATQNLVQACEHVNALTRNGVSAAARSVTVMTKGTEELCEIFSTMFQTALSHSLDASRSLMGVKTLREAIDTQSNIAQSGMDMLMAQINKVSEVSTRVTQEAIAPVAEHVNASLTEATSTAAKTMQTAQQTAQQAIKKVARTARETTAA